MSVRRTIGGSRSGRRHGRTFLRASFLGLLVLCSGVQAARAQFTRFQNITDEQGLGNLAVSALAQDRDGYILIGTEAGLYRYDGIGATPYDAGLPSAAWIQQIVTDGDGRVWVATNDGLYMRSGATFGRVEVGRAPLHLRSSHLLAAAGGSVVLNVDGTLLRARVEGSAVGEFSPLLDTATADSVPGLAHAGFVAPDTGGTLLVGCGVALCLVETGLVGAGRVEAGRVEAGRVEAGRVEAGSVEAGRVAVLGEADGLPADAWQMAVRTPDGTLWARSLERIAWRRPGQAKFAVARVPTAGEDSARASGEHTTYAANPEMLDLLHDGHGGVLTQSASGVVDWDGTSWRRYKHHLGGLPPGRIQILMLDREGSLWTGSFGMGVFRSIGLGEWEHWTASDGLPSSIVWAMARLPDGQFWVATDSGTVPIDGTTAGIPAETNYVVETTRGGRLWLAPAGLPLTRRDPARGVVEQFPPVGKVVVADVDRDNRLWLGGPDGLFMLADADAPATDLRTELVLAHEVTLVATDPAGLVWALSPDGIFRRDDAGRFDLVVSPALLDSPPVALDFADGDLWVGTGSKGVLRFRMTDGRAEPLPSFTAPVIGSNNVLFVHRDRRGWMWVGTDHGLDVFDGQGWRRLDSSSGPITNDMNQSAVHEDPDGSMWFGTTHGVSHLIDPARLRPLTALHPLVTSVSMGERALDVSQDAHADWSPEPFVIRFADLDYSRGRGITFRYRLRGLDAGWGSTTEHEVRYPDLPAGLLRFELVAVDAIHGAVSAETGFTIRICAPWWRRWWFHGLCGFAAMAALAGTWRARMRFVLHNQRRLEELVGARTAEIEQARSELQHQAGELERQAIDMQRLAMSDVLTGLANRRAIMGALEVAIAAAAAAAAPLAVLLCDIDHFKRINDGFGHIAGDGVLVAFGRRLGAAVRAPEAVGRYGGEEFLLLLPGDPDALAERVAAIRSAIADAPYVFGEAERTVTASGGLAFLRAGDTAVSLIGRADVALYRAKRNGRNRIEEERSEAAEQGPGEQEPGQQEAGEQEPGDRGPELPAAADAVADAGGATASPPGLGEARADDAARAPACGTRDLERDLRAALAHGEFLLHYQPVVDVERGLVTSYEALLRWQSPSRGNVAPVDFIPFAEAAGLMTGIGDWVLQAACREAAGWEDGPKVSVNLSPVQFRLPDLVDRIAAALAGAGLPPERLELEITETAMIDDVAAAARMLHEVRAMGVSIALDDFGTGYSSLSFLRALPFNRIKIDRSFVQDLGVRPGAIAIVRAVVELCRGLGVATTAEGVETDQQIELLRAAGCLELQGYRIGLPRPPSELAGWRATAAERHTGEMELVR